MLMLLNASRTKEYTYNVIVALRNGSYSKVDWE